MTANRLTKHRNGAPPPPRSLKRDLMRASCLLLLLLLILQTTNYLAKGQLVAGPPSRQVQFAAGPMLQIPALPQSQPIQNELPPAGFWRPNDYVDKIIWPYDSFDREQYSTNGTSQPASNVIEHKRFVESVSSRCMTSTVMEDPMSLEPSFVLIKPQGETRLRATSHPSAIAQAGYEPHKPTVLLIHGFTQSYPETVWLRHTRALFERHGRTAHYNLIIMDWSPASKGSYAQAAAMASGMGSFLANFLMKLYEELGANRQHIHLVGHSLGAHVAGFAGKRIRPRLGRITALDPAGPCFGKILSNSPTDRLSPDDAIEVDVYHYDDDFLGLPGQHGQFDVFVNGGSNQPGCAGNVNAMFGAMVTMLFRLNRVLSESHTRSTEVATVPLEQQQQQHQQSGFCQLVAYECRDYAAFTLGECAKCDDFNGQCFSMGFNYQYPNKQDPESQLLSAGRQQSNKQQQPQPLRTSWPGKRLYIQTSERENYCLQHYQILVKFEPTPEMAQQAKKQKWRLQLDLIDDRQRRMNFTAHNQMAPNVFSYLLLSEGPPTRIRSAELQVRTHNNSPVPLVGVPAPVPTRQPPKRAAAPGAYQVFAIDVQFMSDINPQGRRVMSSRLCAFESSNLIADSSSASSSSEWLHFEECL